MSIPSGPDMGPVTYPDSPRIYIDVERDTAGFPPAPPAPASRQPRRGPSAGVVIGLIAAICAALAIYDYCVGRG